MGDLLESPENSEEEAPLCHGAQKPFTLRKGRLGPCVDVGPSPTRASLSLCVYTRSAPPWAGSGWMQILQGVPYCFRNVMEWQDQN